MTAPLGEIYLIDDEVEILEACRQTFELEGYAIRTFNKPRQALTQIRPDWLGVVITDVKMPEIDGITLLEKIHATAPEIPVVILTGHGDVPMALRAMRAGAYDFLEKPAPPEYLVDVARRALESRRLTLENRALKEQLATGRNIEGRLLGNAAATRQLRQRLISLASIDVDVLLIGETGVGKELAARCLHDFGHRSAGQFVALNCGAIPSSLVESMLFGHEKGAFTSAADKQIGKIEYAQGGTLFLDEVEAMPLDTQVKLLRALQERTIERVGSNRQIPVDFRVIAATKVELRQAVDAGSFRADLFYRLNVAPVRIPPLRERREDLLLLLEHFMVRWADKFNCAVPNVTADHQQRLLEYSWPGNVRELKNIAQQLLLDLPLDLQGDAAQGTVPSGEHGLDEQLWAFEKKLLSDALAANHGRIEKTAEQLKIPRKRLYLRMQKFNLRRS